MGQRTPGNCFNTLVFNNFTSHEECSPGLTRAEQQLCYRGVEAYLRACRNDRKIKPERKILLTGANCGELDKRKQIVRDNGTMAAFVLEKFSSIPESDLLIGVETPDIAKNLIACRKKHKKFAENVSRSGNQTLGVVSYENPDEDEDPADYCLEIFGSRPRQLIRLPIYHLIDTGRPVVQEPVLMHEQVETQEDVAMAADS